MIKNEKRRREGRFNAESQRTQRIAEKKEGFLNPLLSFFSASLCVLRGSALNLSLSSLLICLLYGCTVGPDYKQPYVEIPEDYRFKIDKSEDTLNTAWWELFNDDVLICLIDEALANNYNIKIASANVDRALGILVQVRSQWFPQIGYSVSGMKTLQSEKLGGPSSSSLGGDSPLIPDISGMVPNPITTFQAVISGTWNLDLWGRVCRLVESAKANLFATEEAHRAVIQSIVTLTANTYLQLLGLDAQLRISKETLESYGEMVIYFEKQYRYGQVSRINVAQALTQYEQAAAAIPALQIQIAQTENALSVILGRPPDSIPRGKDIYTIKVPPVPEGIPADILARRPDVRQAELELIRENALIGAAIAEFFPSFSLTGYYGGASQHLKDLFSGPAATWNIAANIMGPLFTFGGIEGKVMEAKASTRAAFFNYQNTILNGFKEVEDALVAHTLLVDQLDALMRLVRAASEYEYLAMLQYREGYAPYFAVLQAQQQLFPAELNWVQIQVQLFTSLVNIYQAMGGGWVVIAECRTEP